MTLPSGHRPSTVLFVALLAGTLASPLGLAGCYNSYQVVPTELVKLSSTRSATASVSGTTMTYDADGTSHFSPTSGTVQAHESVKLVRADGGVASVRGDADVTITTAKGTRRFMHPIMAELQGTRLVVRGDNGGETFPVNSILNAKVRSYDDQRTQWAMVGGVAAAAAVVLLVAVGVSN